jgi:membrane associated rhomboid family serine protease
MGASDRDYWRPHHRAGSGPREAGRLTPVVKGLLVANLVVFFADVLFFPGRDGGFGLLGSWGALSVRGLAGEGRWWELLSFQFVHAGLGHLAVNMIGLVLFGHFLERWWGAGRFLAYYLLCGVGGGLLCVGLCLLGAFGYHADTHLVGASAGIFGLVVGVAVLAPALQVRLLFPPIELSMRQMALALLGLAVLMILTNLNQNAGGEAGHLGGLIVGYLLMRRPALLNWAGGRRRAEVEIIAPRTSAKHGAILRPVAGADPAADEVDRILDKISAHGLQSLTAAERAVLDERSRHSRPFP